MFFARLFMLTDPFPDGVVIAVVAEGESADGLLLVLQGFYDLGLWP